MSLDKMLRERFGVKTAPRVNPLVAQLAAGVATQILPNNPNRVGFLVVNLGANPCYIMLDNLVSAARGIYLSANGGAASGVWDEDFQIVAWGWWGFCAALNNILVISIEEV